MQNDEMEMRLLEENRSSGFSPAKAGTGLTPDKAYDTTSNSQEEDEQERADSRTFFRLLSLWIGTIILTASVVAIVKIYHAKGIITAAQKDAFNVLATILILILGLSFFEAFKELARAMQGRILRLFDPQKEDLELVKNFDSLLKVVRLTCVTRDWWLRLFCIVWLLVNFAALISTALISLQTTTDDGTNYNDTYVRGGKVRVSNLTCYFHGDHCPSPVTHQALAHAYGETTLASESRNYTEIADVINSKQDYKYYCRQDGHEFAYRFNEYNPADIQKTYPRFTQRIITATSGECIEYDQDGASTPDKIGDMSASKFKYRNGSTNGSIIIPTSSLGREGTTYIYRDDNVPAQATTYQCGERCIRMWVYKNPGATDGPKFYECPITVSVVSNVEQPAHNVSNGVARVAVASIALQGQFHGPFKEKSFAQYQFYASGTPWEVHYQSREKVGANIARFAIRSFSRMVSRNPPIHVDGTVPYLGSRLSVRWKSFAALLASIVVIHFAVFALTFLVARPRSVLRQVHLTGIFTQSSKEPRKAPNLRCFERISRE